MEDFTEILVGSNHWIQLEVHFVEKERTEAGYAILTVPTLLYKVVHQLNQAGVEEKHLLLGKQGH